MKNSKIENTGSQKSKILPLPFIKNHKTMRKAYKNAKNY